MLHCLYGLSGGGVGFMMFGGLFSIILLGVLVYYIFNNQSNTSQRSHNGKSARDILDEEYARGNLSDEEYDKRKQKLS